MKDRIKGLLTRKKLFRFFKMAVIVVLTTIALLSLLGIIVVTGFEPAASWSQTRRSTKLSHTPLLGTVLRAPALNASNIIV